ncbi:MAG: sulfatase-like hydrolase/transferase [Solirubrobacteraceae bacterium]|jgi:arylsulfatase A-like enzyme
MSHLDDLSVAPHSSTNPSAGAGRLHTQHLVDRRTFIKAGVAIASTGLLAGRVPNALAASRKGVRGAAVAPPNILVIIVDQMRAPCWFSAPGDSPDGLPANLERLRHGAVSFARHYTAANDCTPSRAALLTGLHSHQTGCMITGESTLNPEFPTWGKMLRDYGYATYWYGKWHLTRGDDAWSANNGPAALERYGFGGGTYPSPDGAPGQGAKVDVSIAQQFAQWYGAAAGAGPWCTTVSFVNPHDIAWWYRMSASDVIDTAFSTSSTPLPPNFETPAQLLARGKPAVQRSLQDTAAQSFGAVPFTGPDVQGSWAPFLDLYASLQNQVDLQIGAVLDTLASQPQIAANTVVVFTSDHGEYGASHGMRGKGASVYEEALRVPLIVSDPRGVLTAASDVPRQQLTSSVDVAPLLLTIACGSGDWRAEARYSDLANRPDLTTILANPSASGREYALHATDEVVTEFATEPYAAAAPLHITGVITPSAKYASYTHWQPGTVTPLAAGEQTELYDYTTADGQLEIANVAGSGALDRQMQALLATAVKEELHAPLAQRLHGAQRRATASYVELAATALRDSRAARLRAQKPVVGGTPTTA